MWLSTGACDTRSEPVMPPPPGTFSMMICWPSVSPSVGCRMRASVSIGPPAANGTTMVIGRLGQSWALDAGGERGECRGEANELAVTHESSRRCLPSVSRPSDISRMERDGKVQRHDETTTQRRSRRAAAGGLFGLWPIRIRRRAYPARTITILTPFAAGSVTDAAARVVAQALQETLGQSVVVENRAGAGGLLAANAVARASNDGYTLLLTTNSTHSVVYGLYKNVPYDPIKDFTPIARIGSFASFIAVTPDKPYQSMKALVDYAKANPGKLSYGVGNSTTQIVMEALKKRTGSTSSACPTAAIRW